MRVASRSVISGRKVAVHKFTFRKKVSFKSSSDYRLLLKRKARKNKLKAKSSRARKRA